MAVVAAERETCTRHPGGCGDADRHPLPVRVRTDMKREMAARVADRSADTVNAFAEEAIEARLGFVRCVVCHEAVALTFGNLGGGPLDPWISLAVRTVKSQDCDAHEPVTVGIDT